MTESTETQTPTEADLIARALYVVADTRITDLCASLGIGTLDALEFRAKCWELHKARS